MRSVRWARAGLVIPAWVAIAVLVVPLLALLLKADWAGIPAHLANPTVVPALRLSLLTTSSTLVICALIGTPLAWLLARSTHRATAWLRALVTVPLVLPPVVGGGAMQGLDPRYDGWAATLGAAPWRTFRTVVVPMVAPGIASGAALAMPGALSLIHISEP